jgi:hypothetical protein
MSITRRTANTDPHGPFAWAMSVAVVALEKLYVAVSHRGARVENVDLTLDADEREALGTVAEELYWLSEASQIPVNDLFVGKNMPLRSALRDGFSTLVAIEKEIYPPIGQVDFAKIGIELQKIKQSVEASKTDAIELDELENVQKVCLDLLEHIDRQRPPILLH